MPFGLCPGTCIAGGAWLVAALALFAPPLSLDWVRGSSAADEDKRDVL